MKNTSKIGSWSIPKVVWEPVSGGDLYINIPPQGTEAPNPLLCEPRWGALSLMPMQWRLICTFPRAGALKGFSRFFTILEKIGVEELLSFLEKFKYIEGLERMRLSSREQTIAIKNWTSSCNIYSCSAVAIFIRRYLAISSQKGAFLRILGGDPHRRRKGNTK